MNTDKALANSKIHWIAESGDTGKGRVERISFLTLRFIHLKCKKQVLWLVSKNGKKNFHQTA
jgi:hypothetical protein